jgi:uncharacterized membrane protein
MMSRSRHPLLSLCKDFIIGLVILGIVILIWQIVKEAWIQLVVLSPVDPDWFYTSWLKTALSLIVVLSVIVIIGRLCQMYFGRRLATTPGFRRLARSGELLITELSPKESQAFKVVLARLSPDESRKLAILTSVLDDSESGLKLATIFIPSTPNVRSGETRLLPLDAVTITNWKVSDAITFLMSGGTVSPSKIHFTTSAPELKNPD